MKHAGICVRMAAVSGLAAIAALPGLPAHRLCAAPLPNSNIHLMNGIVVEPGEPGFLTLSRNAKELMRTGDWKTAAYLLSEALGLQPGDAETQFMLGTAYIQLNMYPEALRQLEPLLAKQSRNADLKNNIAWICVTATDPAVRDVGKALHLAREAILEAPDAPNIWNTLAAAHYALGDYGHALRASQIAVMLARKQGENRDTMDLWEMLRRCERAAKNPAPGAGAAAARP